MFIKFLTQIQLSTSSKIKMHLYQNPQDSNGLVGSLGLGFRFEGAQIQILCLGKLKEMDLDWFKIQLELIGPNPGFQISHTVEFGDLSCAFALFLCWLVSLRVSLSSHNSQALLPSLSLSLSRQLQVCFSQLLWLIFLSNLSNSLFLLNLNPKGCGIYLIYLWVCLGFVWSVCGFWLICLWILFHGIFNDFFWVRLYFLFVFLFVRCKLCVWWNASINSLWVVK